MASSTTTAAAVRNVYRELVHIAKQQHQSQTKSSTNNNEVLQEIRAKFRRPVAATTSEGGETAETRLKQAHDRLSFLRISSVKVTPRRVIGSSSSGSETSSGTTRWVYRDGQKLEHVAGTLRDAATGRVISPYDGKNLDPESVTRHRKSLKRAGFVNNSHAKGIF